MLEGAVPGDCGISAVQDLRESDRGDSGGARAGDGLVKLVNLCDIC